MELSVDRIATQLKAESLRLAYLVAGPETLLVLEAADAGESAPWEAVAGDSAAMDLRRLIGQIAMAFGQVIESGTPDQIQRARDVLNDARKALYGILAEDVDPS